MLWEVFAFLSAIFSASGAIIQKKTLFQEHATEFSAVLAVVNAIIALPFFFFVNYHKLDLETLGIIFIGCIFSAAGFLFIAKATRHMEFSASSPLLVLDPAFVALLALIFLNERLIMTQWLGIAVLAVGSYLLEVESGARLLDPLKVFLNSKYVHYLLFGLFLYGFSALVDRYSLHNKNVEVQAYLAFTSLFIAIIYLFWISIFYDGFKGIKNGLEKSGKYIVSISLFTISYRLSQILATKLFLVGPVIAIKRTSVLFSTTIGGRLFQESSLLRKSLACIIMIIGAALVTWH